MRLLLKLIICISTLTLCIISCQEKSNINFIGDISEGFCQAKKLNRKVLLIVGAKDCGKCSKFVEYISEDAKIRKSLENDFVVVYEGNTDNNIGAKLTRCFAMPMPYVFKNNGQLISFGYPQKNKMFSDTLGVGMDDMGYLELFNLSISQVEYKAMVSKSVQSFLSLTDTTSKIENLKNAYREIKESIKIKPYCYNLYLAYVLAKQLGTTELESHEYLVEMQNIMRPIDRHIYDDILKELFNLTKEDIKNINSDKNELLKLSCKDIDMGKIKLKDKQKFSFEIINHHSEPVIVKAIRASCTCVEINIPKEPILPNKSSVINGFFKAKHKGKFSRILFIHTNSRQLPLKTVVIKGTVI